jgi:endonuclease-8
MPEGDTLRRVADRLRPALAGKPLARFEAPRLRGDRPAPGDTIDAVVARGKHLLIEFGGGLTLRTHLRMAGSWHLYRTGERWRKPHYLARAVVETGDGWCAVCFSAPVVETFHRRAGEPPALARLGPDLADPDPDLDAVVERLAALAAPDDEIGAVLLDQRIAAGIGNVYKSEACFACRLDPFTPVGQVPDPERRRLYATAHRMIRANLGGGLRRTLGPGVAIYRRAGRECPRCGSVIRRRPQGEQARTTYWCPGCQTAPVP